MTTKNFKQMSTKKLEALLVSASEEDKVAIQDVLNARAIKATEETATEETATEETATEETATEETATPAKPKKMTDEELDALVEELRTKYMHKKCEVVPFNTIEWVQGYIAGVTAEKRSAKVLFAIKLEDGRRIVKVHDSKLIKISDETADIAPVNRPGRKAKTSEEIAPWTDEERDAEVAKVIPNIGKLIEFTRYNGAFGQGEKEQITGRIVGVTPDKRVKSILMRVAVAQVDGSIKTMHKVVKPEGQEDYVIAPEFDEEGQTLHDKYMSRKDSKTEKANLTPQESFLKKKEAVAKLEERIARLNEELAIKKQALAEAEAKVKEFLAAQEADAKAQIAEDTEELNTNDDLA